MPSNLGWIPVKLGVRMTAPKGCKMLQVHKTCVHGAFCYYLVQTFTVNGRPRQRVLFNLGEHRTIEEALEYWRAKGNEAKSEVGRKYAAELVRKLSHYLPGVPGDNPPRYS